MSPAEIATRPEFIDVKNIQSVLTGAPWCTAMQETVTIRSCSGTVIDVISVSIDGNFLSRYGKIRREDLGEYILRLMGRFPR
jgi:hypothetical protein